MADSPEHKFISEALNDALTHYSKTRLMGLNEADRRTFDYGCLLLRDFSRPLVSQVLWNHEEGIEKDIRTLVFDGSSSIRLYFVRDRIRNRARIDEALRSYRERAETSSLLRGLRIIPIPENFDADSEDDRTWMSRHLHDRVSTDLLFGVVFGKLTAYDIRIFSEHGGPFGLKFAALQVINDHGLEHGPTFEKTVGSRGSPLREAIAMLTGVGFITSPGKSVQRVPTLKGRFLLDFARRLQFEKITASDWSPELKSIMSYLKLSPPKLDSEDEGVFEDIILEILHSVKCAKSQFGVDLLKGVDPKNPHFYSQFHWRRFANNSFFGAGPDLWNDEDDLPLT